MIYKRTKIITVFLLAIIISTLINYFEFQIGHMFITYLMILISSVLIVKEFKVIAEYSIAYMFNLKTSFFNKRIERPRLFVYLTFGVMCVFVIFQYYHLDKSLFINRYYTSTLFVLIFISCIFILGFSWHKKFEKSFVNKIQRKILTNRNQIYELKWDKEELKLIYKYLEDENFIEFIKDSSKELDYIYFSNLLSSGKLPNSLVFKLNMDNIQTKYFFELFRKNSSGFTLEEFLKIFKNKNKKTSRSSIDSSFSGAKSEPKRKKDIDGIFIRLRN